MPGDMWHPKQSVPPLPVPYVPLIMVGLTTLCLAGSSTRVSQEEHCSSCRGPERLRAQPTSSVPTRACLLAFLEQVPDVTGRWPRSAVWVARMWVEDQEQNSPLALAAAGGDQCHHHCGQDRRCGHPLHAPAEPPPAERSVSGPRGRGDSVARWCIGRSGVAQAEVVDVWLETGQRWARASCGWASWDGKRPDGSNRTPTRPFLPPGRWAGEQRGPNGGEAAAVWQGIQREREPRENAEGTAKIEERSNWRGNRHQRKRMRRNAERLVEEGEERRKGARPVKHSASEEREAAEGKNERVRRSTERGKVWEEGEPNRMEGNSSHHRGGTSLCP